MSQMQVCFGSIASLRMCAKHFCFTPDSGRIVASRESTRSAEAVLPAHGGQLPAPAGARGDHPAMSDCEQEETRDALPARPGFAFGG
jgi:hypothetical protein